MARWRNPLTNVRPMTIGVFMLTALWAAFQWKDPTPPPALDQILVAAFGLWFANETIEHRSARDKRNVRIGKDGTVSISSDDDDDDDDDAIPEGKRTG